MSKTVLFVLTCLTSLVWAEQSPILRFREVVPGVYRGARPERSGVRYLKSIGVKTIINVDNDIYAVAEELREAQKLGLKTLSFPLSSWAYPPNNYVDEVLAEMNNPKNYPIFLHCQHGQDRTGLLVGLFRVEYQGWDPAVAYREMRNLGFHRSLIFLYEYYKSRTGFRRWWEEVENIELADSFANSF